MTTVSLKVRKGYALPPVFTSSSPDEVSTLLDLAACLPPFVRDKSGGFDMKEYLTRALQETVLTSTNEFREEERRRLEEHSRAMSDKEKSLLLMEREVEAVKKEAEAALKSVNMKVEAAKQEEAARVRSSVQKEMEEARREVEAARCERVRAEEKVCSVLQERCEKVEEYSSQIFDLTKRINELETPMGRGNVGEVDVAQCLKDAGFTVEDTSKGEMKNAGYLDLLVYKEEEASPLRIGVEVKNKKEIKREDILSFETHVRNGVQSEIFDAAVFVSIRSHIKRDSSLELFDDKDGKQVVPVTWIGPERGKNSPPLSHDQFEAHFVLQHALLCKTASLKEFLHKRDATETEGDKEEVQLLVDILAKNMNDVLSDLSKISSNIEEMKENLTRTRSTLVSSFLSLCNTNKKVDWLGREVTPPWLSVVENAVRKASTHTNCQIWNDVQSKSKTMIDKSIGKDTLLSVCGSKRGRE